LQFFFDVPNIVNTLSLIYSLFPLPSSSSSLPPIGMVTTYAGTGKRGSRDGSAAEATFYYPMGLAVDERDGSLYVVDAGNGLVRKISPSGTPLSFPPSPFSF
jgi:hypothetical protein